MLLTPSTRAWSLAALLCCALSAAGAHAQRTETSEALSRLEETLALREQDGAFLRDDLAPIVIVSVMPAYEESRAWYPTAATAALARVFGAASLRACEGCMAPRLYVGDGAIEQNLGVLTIPEIVRLDDATRGAGAPARAGVWLDESAHGVSLRIIDLKDGRLVFAQNFDAELGELLRTERNMRFTRELERRARGDGLSHVFIDAAVLPLAHVSADWVDQWGDDNRNLSGLSVSLFDPVIGVGGCYYRVIPEAFNLSIGGQVLVSLPTALIAATGSEVPDGLDPLVTGALVVRLPIASTSYAVLLTASTNGRIGVGISLMNLSFLPVIP